MSVTNPVLCLVGPTCSGKSTAAMSIAARGIEGKVVEIISMDSANIYRGMDIGTAKPTREERERVPHHLIDILEPTESYSAAQFAKDATRLVHDIRARGNEPLIVGGTMLYLKALREGLNVMPASDPAIRAQIDLEAAASSWPAMHALLKRIDPITAERLNPNDQQRIQRALEVWRISGKPLSSFHAEDALTPSTAADENVSTPSPPRGGEGGESIEHLSAQYPPQRPAPTSAGLRGGGVQPMTATPPLPTKVLALIPEDRAELHVRIAARFHVMLEQGLLDEVQSLMARGDLTPDMTSMRCVGYRQAWEHLAGEIDYATFVEKGIAATRQLAKRQLTWLRGMSELERFDSAHALAGLQFDDSCII
jgi:tRNA dimethylallyltransferase